MVKIAKTSSNCLCIDRTPRPEFKVTAAHHLKKKKSSAPLPSQFMIFKCSRVTLSPQHTNNSNTHTSNSNTHTSNSNTHTSHTVQTAPILTLVCHLCSIHTH
eukprot:TRINITY_DN112864_c0_g2_i1.p1 TRINITY_DN112864_c0_g2~~TRINITY_DN112864_c0_g2_i1.p1  ORF type:complete len:102 (+),score=7.73 TRINITY_DN112864_c0_g2_i1:108-413(+)